MNRLFGITGFLGAGQFVFLVWFLVSLPFMGFGISYASGNPPFLFWRYMLYGVICAIGLGIVYTFVRYSLKDHWAALRRNTPMPPFAWRGVSGIYLFCIVIFGLPASAFPMWGARPIEMLLYVFLASVSLFLCVHAVRNSGWCAKRKSSVTRV